MVLKRTKETTFRIKPCKANDFTSVTFSVSDVKFLNEMFHEIDLDGSGYIGRSELSKNLKQHMSMDAQKFLNDYISLLDSDKDGKISFKELVKTLYPGGKEAQYDKILKISLPSQVQAKKRVLGKLTEQERGDFIELFSLYDLDESGHVDIFEFKEGIHRTGLMDINLCDTVFESMDTNEDGQISIKEFLNFFAKT
ncbi:hypothetical protein HOP50_12g65320 [Chloropicon primus]|uniref:EF-hand domain-containing protein n=1 Tax=Chloropicon primus TaxID=1764295 RepID=A0A5B8MWP3_9CHLO|nr:hypothetical protein A3770_12p65100 [Chloropicon primus]UPR03204.1 hypothetical protein HOP50_12g65320 [Chloropicon primus]|eukprot:QDZ23992.1 hypothetical protein A3770_12p65100 [Chloropicon primus]